MSGIRIAKFGGSTRRRIGQQIPTGRWSSESQLLFDFGLDDVKCEVFPSPLGLILGESQSGLEFAANLVIHD